jgi:triacylglycerol lipase
MQLIFVHGIWDTGAVFRRLAKYLTDQGHTCHCPSLEPANGQHGIIDLAEKLQDYIHTTIGDDTPFALIGFSMGTIISRYYLQILGGSGHVHHFFSISGPLHGTLTAHVWRGKAARDMRFGSSLIRRLDADTSALQTITIHSYRTPFDLLIIPSRSSHWNLAEDNHIVPALFHHQMLIHPKVMQHIATTLNKLN